MKRIMKTASALLLSSTLVLGNAAFVQAEEVMSEDLAIKLEFAMSDTGKQLMSSLAGVDLSWLSNVTIDYNASVKDTWEALEFVAALNDTSVLTGTAYMDLESLIEYVQIHELSEEYIMFNIGEFLTMLQSQLQDSVSVTVNGAEATSEALSVYEKLQDEEVVNALVEKYGMPLLSVVEEAKVKEAEVSYQGQSATVSYTGLQANLGDIADVMTSELNTLKEDADTLSMVNELASASGEEITPEMLDEAITLISNAKAENNFAAIDLKAMYGMSEDGAAYAGYLAAAVGDDEYKVADFVAFGSADGVVGEAYVGTDDENYGVMFDIKGDAYTFVLAADHAGIIQAQVIPEGEGGKIVITPVTDYEGAPLADYEGFALELFAVEEGEGGEAGIRVIYNEEALFTITGTVTEGSPLEIPDLSGITAYDVNDEDAMEAYGQNVDLSVVLNNLINAGMPEELVNGTEDDLAAE